MWFMNGNDLPKHSEFEEKISFWDHGCESPELFETWKQDPKMDPIYLDKSNPITYKRNSYGYRCEEFSEYEDEKFILVIGCSHTFGTGLHNEHIWCNQLGKDLNMPVMNLANGGFGPDYVYIISSAYSHNENYPKPAAVVIQWPQRFRKSFAYTEDNGQRITLDPTHPYLEDLQKEGNIVKQKDYIWYYERYVSYDAERIKTNHYNFMSVQKLWKGWGVPVYNWSFEDDYLEEEIIGIDINVVRTEHTGYARDLQHDGRDIHKQAADKIRNGVLKCLVG